MSGQQRLLLGDLCEKGLTHLQQLHPQQAQFTRSVLLDQFRPRGFRPHPFVAYCVEWVRGSG
jgi:hypothetical protein